MQLLSHGIVVYENINCRARARLRLHTQLHDMQLPPLIIRYASELLHAQASHTLITDSLYVRTCTLPLRRIQTLRLYCPSLSRSIAARAACVIICQIASSWSVSYQMTVDHY
jgi:hypothetical protein